MECGSTPAVEDAVEAVGGRVEKRGEEEGEKTSYRRHPPLVFVAWAGRKLRERPRSTDELVKELERDCKSVEHSLKEGGLGGIAMDPELEALCVNKKEKDKIKIRSGETIKDYVKRALYALEAAGFIRERRGKGEKVWEIVRDWQEFKTEGEYRLRLMHSCLLFCEALNLERDDLGRVLLERELPGLDAKQCPALCEPGNAPGTFRLEHEPLLEHLKTGYPEAYGKYLRWKDARERVEKLREELRRVVEEVVEEIARARGFTVKDYAELRVGERAVSSLIYEYVERALEVSGHTEVGCKWLEEGGGCLSCLGRCLAADKRLRGDVEALISEVIKSPRVRDAWESLKRAEHERDRAQEEYVRALRELWDRVRHGEPLRGHCGRCPRVTIGRE